MQDTIYKYPVGTKLISKWDDNDRYEVVGHHDIFNIVRSVDNLDGPGGIYDLDCHIPMFYNVIE